MSISPISIMVVWSVPTHSMAITSMAHTVTTKIWPTTLPMGSRTVRSPITFSSRTVSSSRMAHSISRTTASRSRTDIQFPCPPIPSFITVEGPAITSMHCWISMVGPRQTQIPMGFLSSTSLLPITISTVLPIRSLAGLSIENRPPIRLASGQEVSQGLGCLLWSDGCQPRCEISIKQIQNFYIGRRF
jgi:hypothetical protein